MFWKAYVNKIYVLEKTYHNEDKGTIKIAFNSYLQDDFTISKVNIENIENKFPIKYLIFLFLVLTMTMMKMVWQDGAVDVNFKIYFYIITIFYVSNSFLNDPNAN